MRTTRTLAIVLVASIATLFAGSTAQVNGQCQTATVVSIGSDDIGGVVTSRSRPEAGVWVIAETSDLPTRFVKIVVTDDNGRYVLPDLPDATYRVWVRGYGLVDSPKVNARPGEIVNLNAAVAPTPAQAAEYYPAIHWFSMLRVPEKSEFPVGRVASQGAWLNIVKSGACQSCHALGTKGMRTISKELGEFTNSVDAWSRRLQAGSARALMARDINRLDSQRALELFADWTDRIAAGELPFAKPERPQGIERNLVITLWDWSRPTAYLHDAISTDRRNPKVNASGRIYGTTEDSTDFVPMLDPNTHTATEVKHPVRDPETGSIHSGSAGTCRS